MDAEQSKMSLIGLILRGEREQANTLLDDYAASHDYRAAMSDVLEPVLEEIKMLRDISEFFNMPVEILPVSLDKLLLGINKALQKFTKRGQHDK